ncbi:MAG: diacylglycerol kinase family protein [Parvibaculum sp.]|uniref:diacylglycerol/lipid kinase family protein n=1 Tax=Parvibaculum sp. TaxID=2024848 RepID=UPI00272F9E3D|nr:diacylglycerol kinase family protein [Parvibaculum sp.]MDP2149253.1 diacylglycerol kinase family protein [Parvibaculum sp.]
MNAAAGHGEGERVRGLIEPLLASAGRSALWLMSGPGELGHVAREAATEAQRSHGAVVAVGGDGTINTVAQAAHAAGCALGVLPQGTFNYFARSHGIPFEATEAAALLLVAVPAAVQVAAVNERLFLVNASLGLYPDLLEDREAYKARWGRSRVVALGAGFLTLLRAQRRLHLQIERHGEVRELRALTLFVGNNRMQLRQLGVEAATPDGGVTGEGCITAVMLRPVGTLSMLGLMWRGAMGTLGEADDVERFAFTRMRVQPSRWAGRRSVKVAYDGEVCRLQAPLDFRVHPRPLYLLKAPGGAAQEGLA